jgi:hypothetical protein
MDNIAWREKWKTRMPGLLRERPKEGFFAGEIWDMFHDLSEWISVKDRLPEERQKVLFVVDSSDKDYANTVQAGRYNSFKYNDGFIDHEFSFPGRTTHATHWMPLPEPPQ